MIDLQKLLASDLSKVELETLLQGVRDSEITISDQVRWEWTGKLVAQIKRQHKLSWPELERLTGVSKGTLIRRAQPYL